jgi:TIR domain
MIHETSGGLPSTDDGVTAPFRIFINYRHADTGWAAWALYLMLEGRFGTENVFFDNGTLRPGMEWFEEIKSHVGAAGAFIALIGPQWMTKLVGHLQGGGQDYVAKEIDMALRSAPRVVVIPVLVDDAEPPNPGSLPPALKAISARHVERVRHTHAREDIENLIARLDELRDIATERGEA